MPSNNEALDEKYLITKEEAARLAEHKAYKIQKEQDKAKKAGSWSADESKTYGFTDFIKFSVPMLWKGGCGIKFLTVLMLVSLILSRLC